VNTECKAISAVASFHNSSGPRRLQLLFLSQGFSNGTLDPPWRPWSGSLGGTRRGRCQN